MIAYDRREFAPGSLCSIQRREVNDKYEIDTEPGHSQRCFRPKRNIVGEV
jgi:hypothetical protein